MPTEKEEYARPARPPDTSSLAEVLAAASKCTACHLYKRATQTVFGEGPKDAPMMLVGEQPGDYEDVAGKPFVGPAGKIMDQALEEAGIDRKQVYVTNAVKHFKWEPRGKRRIHQKPNSREIAACRPWLEAELRLMKPKLLVCLGATAAQTIFGPSFRVTRERGKVMSSKFAPRVLATVHPSSLLRQPDEESRQREYKNFVADLRVAVNAAPSLIRWSRGRRSLKNPANAEYETRTGAFPRACIPSASSLWNRV
jgi:uracil-DNA glycosylase family protein